MSGQFFGRVRSTFSFLFLRSRAKNLARINNQLKHLRKLGRMFVGRKPPVCTDIGRWAARASKGEVLGTIGHQEEVRRTLPCDDPAEPFAAQRVFQVHPRPVVRIDDATLLGQDGFVVLPDGQRVLQTVWYPRQLTQDEAYSQRTTRSVEKDQGSTTLCASTGRGPFTTG